MVQQIGSRKVQPDIVVLEFLCSMIREPECEQMEKLVSDLLGKNERKLIIDLSGVKYLNSMAMGVIAQCFHRARKVQGALRIAGAGAEVYQIFRTTRLDTMLPFYPTVESATYNFNLS